MNVDIICPLYNAEIYIQNLIDSIKMQKGVEINKIRFIVTESKDNTQNILEKNHFDYTLVKPSEFSHSLTRETEAMKSNADILVFITQDVVIERDDWLKNLIKPIEEGECEASFSRQTTKFNNIEKYTREKNYPSTSYINSKSDISQKGLNTVFFSDASSAIKTSIFKELGGYDGKRLPINEDMYIAYKIIMVGYRIKYCADSVVKHSHKFSLKQLYQRYYSTGQFMAENPEIYKLGATRAGGGMAGYVFRRALCQFNIPVLFRFLPDMFARWLGMKNGIKDSVVEK